MQKDKHWFLRLGVTQVPRPDVELQAVLRRRIVVLGCEILPYT